MTGADIANGVQSIFSFATSTIEFIAGNPLLLVFACTGVVGAAIGVVRNLIGRY